MSNVVNFQDYRAKSVRARQFDDPYFDALVGKLEESQRLQDETISEMVARMMQQAATPPQ